MAEQLQQVDERRLRIVGGVLVVIGLVVLQLVR